MGQSYLQQITQFIATVVDSLDIDSSANGPTVSRVGLITYGTSANVVFGFQSFTQLSTISQNINQALNVQYLQGGNNLAPAIT